MVDHLQPLLAEAAQALLAGRPHEARTRYEALAGEAPRLATFGLCLTAWFQGDFRALRPHLDQALEAGEALPQGFLWALEGLAMIHAGAVAEGLERQQAGLAEARRLDDGAELNAAVAYAEALLQLGRWAEAGATIAAVRPLAESEAPMAAALLDRLSLALAVLTEAPEAGEVLEAAVEAACAREDEAGAAWALRWQGAWLSTRRPDPARAAFVAAVARSTRAGQHLVAAEALAALATLEPEARAERLAAARLHARASGSALAEIDVAIAEGGEAARAAARRLETLLRPLEPAAREACWRWPGRAGARAGAAVDTAAIERLGALLAAIAAQPDMPGVSSAALAAFVDVAAAERGFLLRLTGFEVIDQVVVGAAPDAYSTSLAGRVMWTGEPLVVEDLETDAELGQAGSVQELGLRMALGMPLLAGGEVVGVMLADSREAHPGFSAEALAIARGIADYLVVAWESAARAERARAGEAAEAALARAAIAAARATTLEAALPAIAIEAAARLGAERLFVCVGAELTCRAAVDAAGEPLAGERPSMGAVHWVAEKGQSLVVVDAQQEEAFAAQPSIRELSLRMIHAAPLPEGAGVLYMDARDPVVERPEARRVLGGLAEIVGALLAREA